MTTKPRWDQFLKGPATDMNREEQAYMEMRCKQAAAGFVRGWNKESADFFLGVCVFLREEARNRQAKEEPKAQRDASDMFDE